jgi:chitinase
MNPRFPLRPQLIAAREAAAKYGTKLLICFGGNSRTNGFPQMVSSKKTRRVFIDNLTKLLEKHSMHGVDYNWEYPR